jgi:iron complex transport system substrate-binding protein
MIRDIGAAAGVPERAAELNRSIQMRLDTFRTEARGKPRPSVLMIVGRNPGLLTNMIAVGPGAYLGELLEIAGGRNVLADTGPAYPHISLETVLRLNPDVILDLSMMGDAGVDPRPMEVRLREPWMARRELAAVSNQRVFGLTSESLVTPGPRVVDAVELIRAKLRSMDRSQ